MDFWEEYDRVRCNLIRFIRNEFRKIDWEHLPNEEKVNKFSQIYEKLLKYWKNLTEELEKSSPSLWILDPIHGRGIEKIIALDNLKGAIFEALFYFSWVKVMVSERALKILEFGGMKIENKSIRFEILPISGPIIPIFYQHRKRFAPQIDADFLVLFISETKREIHPHIFIDVKSSKPSLFDEYNKERIKWQALGCRYMNSLFQIAYPKESVEFPSKAKDWEVKTVCYHCGELSSNYSICEKCGKKIAWVIKW